MARLVPSALRAANLDQLRSNQEGARDIPMPERRFNSSTLRPKNPLARRFGVTLIVVGSIQGSLPADEVDIINSGSSAGTLRWAAKMQGLPRTDQ